MASRHQQHKTAVVAVFLAALVLALPAAAYGPDAYAAGAGAVSTPAAESTPAEATVSTPAAEAGYKPGAAAEATPAEATPAEATVSTPAEATPTEATPAEAAGYKPGAAAEATPTEATPTESTPAEETATPTEAAASKPATEAAPGYTAAATTTTTPAEPAGKPEKTDIQNLMETVNAAYKTALDAANNAGSPVVMYNVFDAHFDKAIQEGISGRSVSQRGALTSLVYSAVKEAYALTSPIDDPAERFTVFASALTEALRAMAASLDAHAVKPAAEEPIVSVSKEPAGESQVLGTIDAAVRAAAGAAKAAPRIDRYHVFKEHFSNALGDIGKTVPQLSYAYRKAYQAIIAKTPDSRYNCFVTGLSAYIKGMAIAAQKSAAAKPAAAVADKPDAPAAAGDFFTQPAAAAKTAAEAAYKPAAEAAEAKPAEEAAAEKPAAEAAYKPVAEAAEAKPAVEAAAAKPAGGAVGGYNL